MLGEGQGRDSVSEHGMTGLKDSWSSRNDGWVEILGQVQTDGVGGRNDELTHSVMPPAETPHQVRGGDLGDTGHKVPKHASKCKTQDPSTPGPTEPPLRRTKRKPAF